MSKQAFVFEISEKSFDEYVILNSYKLPVVVEFMGIWSEPSVLTADLFSILATEFAEQFVFAKVDIDEHKALLKKYDIQNIPTILIFKEGKMVRKEEGQLQEVEARSLLKNFGIYRESDLMREQARDKHLQGDTSAAIILLTTAINQDSSNTRIAMDMIQIFIDIGEIHQAHSLFERLPTKDKETDMGKALSGQLTFARLVENLASTTQLEAQLAENDQDFQALFDLAIRKVTLYQYEAAMEHLLKIIENDAEFNDGAARELLLTITNMIEPVNIDIAQQFRRRVANLLSN
jgi:putative thioredoxin